MYRQAPGMQALTHFLQDASVAVAAAINITEPASTGIGGDMFCLYFDAKTKQVRSLNGSGRSPKNTTLESLRKELELSPDTNGKIPARTGLSVTVPGAPAGWCDVVEKFGSGKVTLEQILMPAIELGEKGFPVSELSAMFWREAEEKLRDTSPFFRENLKKDPNAEQYYRAPRAGEIMQMPQLARTFRTLAAEGKEGFYKGRIAKAIVDVLEMTGGHMTLQDLEDHLKVGTEETKPISMKFTGQNVGQGPFPRYDGATDGHAVEIWEHPPNGQGIVALMALGILEELERTKKLLTFTQEDHNSLPYLHALIESLRIAFADANWWVSDPDHGNERTEHMISREYLAERAKLFDPEKIGNPSHGQPGPSPAHNHSDTVYFAVTDAEGNGMSFINSLYTGFGSGIIPEGCGFALQNRGSNFELGPPEHPNIYAGGKRPYHTIIPGLLTHGDGEKRELHSVFGNMGGFMQPQGHVQLLMNMEVFGMNPQQALDAPRICIGAGMPDSGAKSEVQSMTVYVEEGVEDTVVAGLKKLGHDIEVLYGHDRRMMGRGQIIRRHVDEWTGIEVYSAGSDPRGDGCAIPA